jgi:hypothetical protein
MTELESRKHVNNLLLKMVKAKGAKKQLLRNAITSAENDIANRFHGGIRNIGYYHWEK